MSEDAQLVREVRVQGVEIGGPAGARPEFFDCYVRWRQTWLVRPGVDSAGDGEAGAVAEIRVVFQVAGGEDGDLVADGGED